MTTLVFYFLLAISVDGEQVKTYQQIEHFPSVGACETRAAALAAASRFPVRFRCLQGS